MAMGGFGPSSVIESNPIFFITQKYILQIANRQTIWRFSSEHYSLEDAVQHAFLLLNFDPAMILRVVDNQTLDVEWESSNIQDFQQVKNSAISISGIGV